MSTLYGSDAMGGVINIITKKVTDAFQGSVSVAHLFETTKDKEDTTKFSFNAAGPITRDRVGMQLRGSYLTRGASSFGIDKEKRDYDNWNLGTRLTYTPAVGHSYYLDADLAATVRPIYVVGTVRRGYVDDRAEARHGVRPALETCGGLCR